MDNPVDPNGRAYRCTICNINYPPVQRFDQCPVCGEDTWTTYKADPDPNWLEMAQERVGESDGPVPETPPVSAE